MTIVFLDMLIVLLGLGLDHSTEAAQVATAAKSQVAAKEVSMPAVEAMVMALAQTSALEHQKNQLTTPPTLPLY